MIKVYRKTAAIKAEQFDGSDEMIDRLLESNYVTPNMGIDDETDSGLLLTTKRGYLELKVGDWIATGVDGEHLVIADDVFKRTYSELPVIPKEIAAYIEECKNEENYSLSDLLYESLDYPGCAWIYHNSEKVARAWLDGYQVEEQHE